MNCRLRGNITWIDFILYLKVEVLGKLVKGIPFPWEGTKLRLVRKEDVPGVIKATFFIQGWSSKFDWNTMLEVSGLQNKTLNVKTWEVSHWKDREHDTLLVIGLDNFAVYASKAVFFKLGKELQKHEQPKKASKENTKATNRGEPQQWAQATPKKVEYWRTNDPDLSNQSSTDLDGNERSDGTK